MRNSREISRRAFLKTGVGIAAGLAASLGVPLVDLLRSVPMMKTHQLAVVTLGMKNLVAAGLMGFRADEVPTFTWAHKAGLRPVGLEEIEVRGEKPSDVRRRFAKPQVFPWDAIRNVWGAKIL
jgi:hypothetical protein